MRLDYLQDFSGKIEIGLLEQVKEEREKAWQKGHGRYCHNILTQLPQVSCTTHIHHGRVQIMGEVSPRQKEMVYQSAWQLKNWKKGPFDLFHIPIESEWRSDLKWDRMSKHIGPLDGQTILDIGCNNGYFMHRMKAVGAQVVLGIDPMVHFQAQFKLIQSFAQTPGLYFELFGIAEVMAFSDVFDTIFSMGILYHHSDPLRQLRHIHGALKPGGKLVLETIGIPGDDPVALCPPGRYGMMKNIWFIPTLTTLMHWMQKSQFREITVISTEWRKAEEQRSTQWSAPVSYQDFLDPDNQELTVEGHPAPLRLLVQGHK